MNLLAYSYTGDHYQVSVITHLKSCFSISSSSFFFGATFFLYTFRLLLNIVGCFLRNTTILFKSSSINSIIHVLPQGWYVSQNSTRETNQQDIHIKGFIARHWLTWLWKLVKHIQKAVGQAIRKGRLELSGMDWSCCSKAEFLLLGNFTFASKAFQLIEFSPSSHRGQSPLELAGYGPSSYLWNTFTAIHKWMFDWITDSMA